MRARLLPLLLLASFSATAAPLSVDCILQGSCVDAQGAMGHLRALQKIANENGGNRAAGTTGHELSGNYVAQQLLLAGYKVELQPFTFMKFSKVSASFAQAAPTEGTFEEGKDFNLMDYSGSGVATAPITPVDLAMGAGNASTSGCEAEDFAGFPIGHIALIQRGTCPFGQKVVNAQRAGAAGAILFNQGNTPDRETLFSGTLSEENAISIPTIAVSYNFAMGLMAQEGLVLTLGAQTQVERKTSFNVIAETREGNPDNVVMVGAHLDSVAAGPGINDNGSGSATILEIALGMKNLRPLNKLRFAWFSAEELGLIGSTKYVGSLSQEEKNRIALYVNVDMVGSPNYKLAVYDGDGSKFGQRGPRGSDRIERKFHNLFSTLGVQSVETELNGRSDYAAFSAVGIAVGGVFTGAEGVKTPEEAALFGGKAGEAYDACYHKDCDGIDNISVEALQANTSAIAFVLLSFADSTLEVRGADKAAMSRPREPVVFPKHVHCQGDMHDE